MVTFHSYVSLPLRVYLIFCWTPQNDDHMVRKSQKLQSDIVGHLKIPQSQLKNHCLRSQALARSEFWQSPLLYHQSITDEIEAVSAEL